VSELAVNERLHIFEDGADSIVAFSLDDAKAIQRETTGIDVATQEDCDWSEIDGATPINIWWDEAGGHASTPGEGSARLVILSADEWIAKAGRGWLCSTEW
jgi:hypothetical protein